MKIKKTLLMIAALSTLTTAVLYTPAYAYSIYNNTKHSLQIKDTAGLAGLNATIPANSSTSCSPNEKGCYGKISFDVMAPQASSDVICTWKGTLKKGSGNYFVISSVPGLHYPARGSCAVEYYHD